MFVFCAIVVSGVICGSGFSIKLSSSFSAAFFLADSFLLYSAYLRVIDVDDTTFTSGSIFFDDVFSFSSFARFVLKFFDSFAFFTFSSFCLRILIASIAAFCLACAASCSFSSCSAASFFAFFC